MSVLYLLLAVLVCGTAGSLTVQPPGTLRQTEGRALQIICKYRGGSGGAGNWSWVGPAVWQGRAMITHKRKESVLRLNPLHAEDNGTYVCLCGSQAATVDIIVHRNPEFLNVPEQQNVTENTTGFILCPVDRGYPEASVRWCKNGRTIVSGPRIDVTHEGLRIADVKPEDAGNYTCSLFRDGWGAISTTIRVQVLSGNTGEPPQIAISAPSVINHTESLLLNCTVLAGTAPVSVEWSTPRGTIPSGGQPILTLDSYSSGEYSCSASNMYGSTSKTLHVNVTVPPLPPFKNWPTQTVRENDTVMLQCQIDRPANPAPSYTWRRLPEGGAPPVPILPQGHFQFTNHQLQISSVRKEDGGLYECIVKNSLGQSKQAVRLHVETPPTPTPTPTTGTPNTPGQIVVRPLRLMTRQCSRQQVRELSQRLITHLNPQCSCTVTIYDASLSCTGDTGVYTANLDAPRGDSLIQQLYRDVNEGRVPPFCGTEACPLEVNSGLLAAIVVLATVICIAVGILFIICYCIKQRSRSKQEDGKNRGSPDASSQVVYDYPRTNFAAP